MRKYLLSWNVVSAALGAIPVARATARSPRSGRVLLAWGGWAIALTIAMLSVHDRSRELETTPRR